MHMLNNVIKKLVQTRQSCKTDNSNWERCGRVGHFVGSLHYTELAVGTKRNVRDIASL